LKNTDKRFDPEVYFEHGLMFVTLDDGKIYLVDTGFGAMNPRYPLLFNPNEKY